jgi:hypothetical protein
MSGSAIRDTDRGYAALVNRVFGLAKEKPIVHVGILEEGASDGGVSVLDVAIWNEFGTATIPERSFIRDWFDENEPKLRADLVTLMRSVVKGERTADQVLELLGQRAVAQIQERISAGIAPQNAASTVAKKKSSTPLVDSGVLRSSVSYRVEK